MASTLIDRLDGLSSSAAIKGPCKAASTANLTLYGEQTIDGVAVVTGDRVLVKNQTDATTNGIYRADTGQWTRTADFKKTRDVVKGTSVIVTDGSTNAGKFFKITSSNPINVGEGSSIYVEQLFATSDQGELADTAVQPATLPTTTFALPIGRYGTGTVPISISEQNRYFVNAKTEGVQLYNNAADTGGGIKDNQAALQDLIDKVQVFGGAIFIPPDERSQAYLTGPLEIREGAGYKDRAVGIYGLAPGDGSRGLRNSYASPPDQYSFGTGLKLKAGSDAALITSKPEAGQLYLKDIYLDGDYGNQLTALRGVDFEPRLTGEYGWSGRFDHVNIINFAGAGIYNGANRNQGLYEDAWVQYCGTDGDDPAVWIDTHDIQIVRCGIGMNRGIGLYIGNTAQLEVEGGAIWENPVNLVVADSALTLNFTRVHFDSAIRNNVEINKYTADGRLPVRVFEQCTFSRRDNDYVDNTYDDIASNCENLVLVAPQFVGAIGGGTRKSRYNLNMTTTTARTMLAAEMYTSQSYATAFTNRAGRIWRQGNIGAAQFNDFRRFLRLVFEAQFDYFLMQSNDETPVAGFSAVNANGKSGMMTLYDGSGAVAVRLLSDFAQGRPRIPTQNYADDAAAAADGYAVGELYFNTTTNAYTKRQV